MYPCAVEEAIEPVYFRRFILNPVHMACACGSMNVRTAAPGKARVFVAKHLDRRQAASSP